MTTKSVFFGARRADGTGLGARNSLSRSRRGFLLIPFAIALGKAKGGSDFHSGAHSLIAHRIFSKFGNFKYLLSGNLMQAKIGSVSV